MMGAVERPRRGVDWAGGAHALGGGMPPAPLVLW